MSSKKNTRLTIAAFIFVAFFLPVFVVISAKSQFGLDEMMGPELDLGCGDGRIVIAAAKNYGARGVGIDLNPKRIEEANANAKAAEVENLVQFRLGNFYKVDFSDATVVALYLPQTINYELRPILWKQLKIGSRVVSNESDMGSEWPAEKIEKVGTKTVYLWTITEKEKQKAAAIPDPD